MANLKKINDLLKEKNRTKSWLAKAADMTSAGLINAIDRNQCTIITLEKIASALEVPVSTFFDKTPIQYANNIGGNNTQVIGSVGSCPLCVEKDKEISSLKDKIISLQEKLIEK